MPVKEIWNLRLTPETKRRWSEVAQERGYDSLSDYVRSVVTEDALSQEEDLAGMKTCLACGNDIPMDAQKCPDCSSDQTDFVLDTGDVGEYGMSEEKSEELAVAEAPPAEDEAEAELQSEPWEGVMGTIGSPTTDGRYLIPDKIGSRELPVEFHMQPQLADGHDGAVPVGRIDSIELIPFSQFDRADEFYDEEQLASMPEHAVVVWGEGELNGPSMPEAKRRIENGADVSIDGLQMDGTLWDSETYAEIDTEDLGLDQILSGLSTGEYMQGLSGDIGGLTIVSIGAFKEARVVTASASLRIVETKSTVAERFAVLVAAAGPMKPPKEWFEDPLLKKLTPLKISKDGRVFGHLADWNGCHVGFLGVCVPPFQSPSNFAYFNVGEIETAEGDLVPCGKLMFSMDGGKHAPTDPRLGYQEIMRHYDDATKVGAFVRAGADRFGTWLAGALRPGLNDIEIQHLRSHPPSGDWRPIRGGSSELLAAFAVAVPGFPIPRGEALVASAGGDISAIITAPLAIDEKESERSRRRQQRLSEAMGIRTGEKSRAEMRRELAAKMAGGKKKMPLAEIPLWMTADELSELAMDHAKAADWAQQVVDLGNKLVAHEHEAQAEDAKEGEKPGMALIEALAPSADQRRQWAKSGIAMSDGSFPITKCSGAGTSAENARRAIGRAPAAKRASVKAHISTREKALGCSSD